MDERQIHISHDGNQSGPFSPQDLRSMVERGEVSPGDLAWHEGMTDWAPLYTLGVLGEHKQKLSTLSVTKRERSEVLVPTSIEANTAATRKQAPIGGTYFSDEERQIRAIGACWYLIAGLMWIIGGSLALFSVPHQKKILVPVGLTVIVVGLVFSVVGYGIRSFKPWAFFVSLISATILLPAFPIGTAISIYVMYQLFQTRHYFQNTDSSRPASMAGFFLSFFLGGAGQYMAGRKVAGIMWFIFGNGLLLLITAAANVEPANEVGLMIPLMIMAGCILLIAGWIVMLFDAYRCVPVREVGAGTFVVALALGLASTYLSCWLGEVLGTVARLKAGG